MFISLKHLTNLTVLTTFTFVFCEYLIYYSIFLKCSWPKLEKTSTPDDQQLKALFFSDPHLLGSREGNWFDKLRREWQMERSFQTANTIFQPEAIFVLGDLLDEGKWASDQEFHDSVGRFKWMFRHSEDAQLHVVVGNHDIGFHYGINSHLLDRFEKAFDVPSVKVVTIKNISFVLVNSMSMHGDQCFMCKKAQEELHEISQRLNCSRDSHFYNNHHATCDLYTRIAHSAPILLQHFPMFRDSDAMCEGEDAAPPQEKVIRHREKWEVLSKASSQQLFRLIRPRFILSGHIHHGCYIEHDDGTPEITVPSFSWRNRNNPSFVLVTISADEISFNKCFVPKENTVITIYLISGVTMVIWTIFLKLRRKNRRVVFPHQAID
ncbi:metallophosphoesterase 1-like [Saccoglossus kowalevskii]|uniref:Metallophosphoesterase 1-like n=1 Tax=Saccoglossus kowalevskii TaxID=10224 RepID=A0ABM0GQJ6_SACKO|nr:PREDICTED: metallophosphoesterase 1-like [Saccoglossus kowalevskii]